MEISENIIHVWHSNVSSAKGWLDTLEQYLVPDEVARSKKFQFQHDQERFIISRGILRVLIGGYLEMDPKQIEFIYGPHGKPELKDRQQKKLHFNLSHANETTLYAITLGQAVGIDVERITDVDELFQVAGRFFSHEEKEKLGSLPSNEYQELFFTYWTRKEAYLKALGTGIDDNLLRFNTASIPHTASKLAPVLLGNTSWSLMDFSPSEGYLAALISGNNALEDR